MLDNVQCRRRLCQSSWFSLGSAPCHTDWRLAPDVVDYLVETRTADFLWLLIVQYKSDTALLQAGHSHPDAPSNAGPGFWGRLPFQEGRDRGGGVRRAGMMAFPTPRGRFEFLAQGHSCGHVEGKESWVGPTRDPRPTLRGQAAMQGKHRGGTQTFFCGFRLRAYFLC